MNELILGDCLEVLPTLEANSIDAIVTDPPYGLGFMGKEWDHGVPGVDFWREALRVAKPGAFLLAFGGTRTFHRLAVAIEDAGWEIRDTIMWVYGSGFPKSHNIGKSFDKLQGSEREITEYIAPDGKRRWGGRLDGAKYKSGDYGEYNGATYTKGISEWEGWGTALKPSYEPIIMARKPLIGTVAQNVLQWGTGGINIDACRINSGEDYLNAGWGERYGKSSMPNMGRHQDRPWVNERVCNSEPVKNSIPNQNGRFPANFIHDGSEEVLELFPETSSGGSGGIRKNGGGFLQSSEYIVPQNYMGKDRGSASRFFYCAKASKSERGEGNTHPTVKPIALMRYLCRLVTPPNGTVLDPFMGSGSMGVAAILEGFDFIGIEKEQAYIDIAQRRIDGATEEPKQGSLL